MLHAVDPLAAVLAAVGVGVGTLAVLLVKLVVALVLATVLPDVVAMPVHHSVLKASLEVAPISPLEGSISTHLVVGPISGVLGAVSPEVDAHSLLDAILEVAVVVATVTPHLDALTVLLVLPCDLRTRLNRIQVVLDVRPEILSEHAQVRLAILLPKAFVNFSRGGGGPEDTDSARLPIDPVAFKGAAVWPDQLAVAALIELVVDDRVIALLRPVLGAWSSGHFALSEDGHESDLPHVLKRAELVGFERKLSIFKTEF